MTNTNSAKALEEHAKMRFDLAREIVRHEDGLVNNRVTWLLVLQGFLVAAFVNGLGLYQKPVGREHSWQILTDLYEYRNRTPGVGHGAVTPPASEVFEARLIVNLCASVLLFLVELDAPAV